MNMPSAEDSEENKAEMGRMGETWPPPPMTPPPSAAIDSRPLSRGYSVGFVGIIVLGLAAFGLSAINSPALRRMIAGVFGLSLCICGFLLSFRDIRASAASGNRDGAVVGGLGLFLNTLMLAFTCLLALYF